MKRGCSKEKTGISGILIPEIRGVFILRMHVLIAGCAEYLESIPHGNFGSDRLYQTTGSRNLRTTLKGKSQQPLFAVSHCNIQVYPDNNTEIYAHHVA